MALHLPQHQEVGHDGVREEGQHDEDQQEQKNISGRDLQFFMNIYYFIAKPRLNDEARV